MARRKSGTGGISKRKDGRWEGRVVIGYDEKGLPKTKTSLQRPNSNAGKNLMHCGVSYRNRPTKPPPA